MKKGPLDHPRARAVGGTWGRLVPLAVLAAAVVAPAGGAWAASGPAPATGGTLANVPVPAAMAQACAATSGPVCQDAVVGAIDRARAREGVRPMVLPTGFDHLSAVAQLLVLADLERTDRGLPGFPGLSSALDHAAAVAASRAADPVGPPGTTWGANMAVGYPTALQADYAWMYDDGPGSPNLACSAAHPAGCWGHRRNILGDYGPDPSMGAAVRVNGPAGTGYVTMTQLFVGQPAGPLALRLPSLRRG